MRNAAVAARLGDVDGRIGESIQARPVYQGVTKEGVARKPQVVTDLVDYRFAVVVRDIIVVDIEVSVIGICPYPWAVVVMNVVVSNAYVSDIPEFVRAAAPASAVSALPVPGIVSGNLVVIDGQVSRAELAGAAA